MQMTKVIATDRGFDGMQVREVGEVFVMPDETLTHVPPPTWFVRYDEPTSTRG